MITETGTLPRPELTGFADRLEAVRKHHGRATGRPNLLRHAFAMELGLSPPRYRRYERGEVQPPLEALEAIRRLTGISLDWLIAGLPRGNDPVADQVVSIGDRLRWARELQEPWLNSCAAVMNVAPELWTLYETDRTPLPVETAAEFAHRFSVSLDYLYRGLLDGVAPRVRKALEERHPTLRVATLQACTDTATDDDNMCPEGCGTPARGANEPAQ